MALNYNSLENRKNNLLKVVHNAFDQAAESQKVKVMEALIADFLPKYRLELTGKPGASMKAKIRDTIEHGLENNDPQMVRAAMEWEAEHSGKEYLSNLVIQITPYEVADKSLKKIVIEADDEIVAEVEQGLVERAARKQREEMAKLKSRRY